MRHRRTGRHPRCGTGAARGRRRAPRDRRADLHPHPRRQSARAGTAAHLRRGGRGSQPCGDRALRGQHRPGLPGRTHRRRFLSGHGPVRRRSDPALRAARRHRRADVRARARREDGALPRRVLLLRRATRGGPGRRPAQLALPAHPQRRHPGAQTARGHRRAAARPCWWTTRAGSSPTAAATDSGSRAARNRRRAPRCRVRWPGGGGSPSAATPPGTATRPAHSSPRRWRTRTPG